jgi:hypothetical protein
MKSSAYPLFNILVYLNFIFDRSIKSANNNLEKL